MESLRDALRPLVEQAVRDAMRKHGLTYASRHEAYGVLAEEVTESAQELRMVEAGMRDLICSIHNEDGAGLREDLTSIRHRAELLACEAIQVAAVCIKAKGIGGEA